MQNEVNTTCGTVALIGAPNAGKSTLLNALVGSKVAIVTPKVQTTRQLIRGIQIVGNAQLIYMDTPGIFAAQQKYEQAMVGHAWSAVEEGDAVVLVADASRKSQEFLAPVLDRLKKLNKPCWLVLNKIDRVPKPRLLELVTEFSCYCPFEQIFMVSALTRDGVLELQTALAGRMPPSPWLYPEDQISDLPLRFMAAEITREKLFMNLNQELPYGLMVQTEQWQQQKNGSVKIHQQIIVQRDGHKKIILGSGGEGLKRVGQSARRDIATLLECPVHLFLFIKVIEDWKDRQEFLPGQVLL